MKTPCGYCDGPDTARMVRRPYGCVCWSCARYIDARGLPAASMIPRDLRRAIIDYFTWGSLRAELDGRVIEDDDSDPFDFLFPEPQSNTSSKTQVKVHESRPASRQTQVEP